MTRDSGSKPDRATTVQQGVVHESHGAGTAIAQNLSAMTIIGEETLRECPFCGSDGKIAGDERVGFHAGCSSCYCEVGEAFDRDAMPDHMFRTEAEAITAWNTRSPEAVADEMIEAGCEAMHKMSNEMLARERSKTPEEMPDYDEGDLCRAIYEAMRDAALLKVTR